MRRALFFVLLVGAPACTEDGDGTPAPAGPTWNADVRPIVERSCLSCHVEGGIAPFSMETYEGVVNHAPMMADQVADRVMPPWPPSADCAPLQHPRVLAQAEIDTIVAWADAGAPEGEGPGAHAEPVEADVLDSVDETIEPAEAYIPRAGRPDDYHCFVVAAPVAEDRDVIAYEVVPGAAAEVHHVILFQGPADAAQATDDGEAGAGWTCFGGSGVAGASMVSGWAPGTPPTHFPDGVGITVTAGNALVMQVHYNLANMDDGPVPDLTRIRLDLADGRVAHPAFFVDVSDHGFAIPPDTTGYSTTASTAAEGPVDIWGVFPHMHTLGTSIRVDGTVGGTDLCLVDIPRWDFHWQQLYLFEQSIAADAGDTGTLTCTWDNPTDDTIHWGEGTGDEMCLNFYLVTLR